MDPRYHPARYDSPSDRDAAKKAPDTDAKLTRRETATRPADGEGKFIRESGGQGQYGHVQIRLEPNPRGAGNVIAWIAKVASIPANFIAPTKDGIELGLQNGVIEGQPITDVTVTVIGGSFHEEHSSEMAFKMAGIFAVKDAMKRAAPIVLPDLKL